MWRTTKQHCEFIVLRLLFFFVKRPHSIISYTIESTPYDCAHLFWRWSPLLWGVDRWCQLINVNDLSLSFLTHLICQRDAAFCLSFCCHCRYLFTKGSFAFHLLYLFLKDCIQKERYRRHRERICLFKFKYFTIPFFLSYYKWHSCHIQHCMHTCLWQSQDFFYFSLYGQYLDWNEDFHQHTPKGSRR